MTHIQILCPHLFSVINQLPLSLIFLLIPLYLHSLPLFFSDTAGNIAALCFGNSYIAYHYIDSLLFSCFTWTAHINHAQPSWCPHQWLNINQCTASLHQWLDINHCTAALHQWLNINHCTAFRSQADWSTAFPQLWLKTSHSAAFPK
jgi:hypothetical protein